MVRGALWLVQVIGEGSTFTKTQLREAFPGVAQADRRIRDLRDYGWVVYSSAEDVTLSRDEQRFISAGVPVWNAKARRENAPTERISARERQAILQRDGYMCTLCGIMGGEPYPDDPVMAGVLSVSASLRAAKKTMNRNSSPSASAVEPGADLLRRVSTLWWHLCETSTVVTSVV